MDETAEQRADDWMCEQLNKILNNIDGYNVANLAKVIGTIDGVMMLANRRKDAEGSYDRMFFDDTDRARYSARV